MEVQETPPYLVENATIETHADNTESLATTCRLECCTCTVHAEEKLCSRV